MRVIDQPQGEALGLGKLLCASHVPKTIFGPCIDD
jgi:hypothetical protein